MFGPAMQKTGQTNLDQALTGGVRPFGSVALVINTGGACDPGLG